MTSQSNSKLSNHSSNHSPITLFNEIRSQPQVLRDTLAALSAQMHQLDPIVAQLANRQIKRVVFTGMGGSFHATAPAILHLIQNGIPSFAIESSELLNHALPLLDEHTLCIAISQSGGTVEVVRLLEAIDSQVRVIGVTNTADSELGRRCDTTICLQAGPEEAVSTKTYTCTVAALHVLARKLTGSDLDEAITQAMGAADCLSSQLDLWDAQMHTFVQQQSAKQEIRFVTYLGRGPSRASAMTGALVTKETAKVPTEGMVGGQYRHGPLEGLEPGTIVAIFAGTDHVRELNIRLARDLVDMGGSVLWIGEDAGIDGATTVELICNLDQWVRPIAEIVPVQFFAAHLAQQRGLVPGKFRFITKVTTVE